MSDRVDRTQELEPPSGGEPAERGVSALGVVAAILLALGVAGVIVAGSAFVGRSGQPVPLPQATGRATGSPSATSADATPARTVLFSPGATESATPGPPTEAPSPTARSEPPSATPSTTPPTAPPTAAPTPPPATTAPPPATTAPSPTQPPTPAPTSTN